MLTTASHPHIMKEHQYKTKHLKTTMKPKHDMNFFPPTPNSPQLPTWYCAPKSPVFMDVCLDPGNMTNYSVFFRANSSEQSLAEGVKSVSGNCLGTTEHQQYNNLQATDGLNWLIWFASQGIKIWGKLQAANTKQNPRTEEMFYLCYDSANSVQGPGLHRF